MAVAEDFKNNPKFQQRVLAYFDQADRNKDGILLMSEVMEYAVTLQQLTNKSDDEMEALRDALRDYYTKCGVTENGARREDWVANIAQLTADDINRMKEGGIFVCCRHQNFVVFFYGHLAGINSYYRDHTDNMFVF